MGFAQLLPQRESFKLWMCSFTLPLCSKIWYLLLPHLSPFHTPHLLVNTIEVSSKAKTVRSSWVHKHTHTAGGRGMTFSTFLQKPYHLSLGLSAHSLSLKNFQTRVLGICPLWTKTSVFASYPVLSYKFKNKSFIKFLFCFLWASSRSHKPGLVAGWNAHSLTQVMTALTTKDAPGPQSTTASPFFLPSHRAPKHPSGGAGFKESFQVLIPIWCRKLLFRKARGERNTLPSPSQSKITAVVDQLKRSGLPGEVTAVLRCCWGGCASMGHDTTAPAAWQAGAPQSLCAQGTAPFRKLTFKGHFRPLQRTAKKRRLLVTWKLRSSH